MGRAFQEAAGGRMLDGISKTSAAFARGRQVAKGFLFPAVRNSALTGLSANPRLAFNLFW